MTSTADAFGVCLSYLPILKLVALKNSLKNFNTIEENQLNNLDNAPQVGSATALALTSNGRSYLSWKNDLDKPHDKVSKLQTFFQISVTALAFLSFGGYLLCLIVQGIKSKGTTYLYAHPTHLTKLTNGVKRIKVYRRKEST